MNKSRAGQQARAARDAVRGSHGPSKNAPFEYEARVGDVVRIKRQGDEGPTYLVTGTEHGLLQLGGLSGLFGVKDLVVVTREYK